MGRRDTRKATETATKPDHDEATADGDAGAVNKISKFVESHNVVENNSDVAMEENSDENPANDEVKNASSTVSSAVDHVRKNEQEEDAEMGAAVATSVTDESSVDPSNSSYSSSNGKNESSEESEQSESENSDEEPANSNKDDGEMKNRNLQKIEFDENQDKNSDVTAAANDEKDNTEDASTSTSKAAKNEEFETLVQDDPAATETAEEEEEQDELYDLKIIFSMKELSKSKPRLCSGEGCKLAACCVWASNLNPDEPWYYCVDCQEQDFGGWPEAMDELPLKFMTEEHKSIIIRKCSAQEDPVMPDLPTEKQDAAEANATPQPKQSSKHASENTTPSKEQQIPKPQAMQENPSETNLEVEEQSDPHPLDADGTSKTENEIENAIHIEEDKKNENEQPTQDTNTEEEEGEGEGGRGELWELKGIFKASDLAKPKPAFCSTEGCNLLACCVWVSNLDSEPWLSCLDCSEADFGGWPEQDEELPIKYLTEESRKMIAQKCSGQEDPKMPNLPTAPPLTAKTTSSSANNDKIDMAVPAITPPPSHAQLIADSQDGVVVGMARAGGNGGGKKNDDVIGNKSGVTPSPIPPSGTAAKAAVKSNELARAPSKEALAIHRKWQAEAEKQGGPDARIVVSKPAAKKIIFDMLHDAFRPMNITEIYQKLKAAVPSPILKSCLDDMVDSFKGNPFDGESDDDNGCCGGKSFKVASKKVSSNCTSMDEYSGSLRIKEGRNANNILYYTDHAKLQNNGNGLLPEDKNELFANLERSKLEKESLLQNMKQITAKTNQLLSEPKNEELAVEIETYEMEVKNLTQKVESAREFASNEKYAKQLNKRIDAMAAVWRKRKRMCMEFIMNMEDATEGTISVKKALSGDGPMEIDSDESAIKGALAYAKRKKPRILIGAGKKQGTKRGGGGENCGLLPTPGFVGVKMNSQGLVERVYSNY